MPQQGAGYGSYEFGQAENEVIDDCAKWGMALAIVYFVVGGITILSLCSSPVQSAINIATYTFVGVFVMLATQALKAVVRTQGNDVAHMMEAMDKLGTMFLIRIIAATVSIVVTIIIMVVQFARLAAMS